MKVSNMTIMTHDEAVKLHMGKLELIKSMLILISHDYKKLWDSDIYRMRESDIKRIKLYVKDIKVNVNNVSKTIKDFEELVK